MVGMYFLLMIVGALQVVHSPYTLQKVLGVMIVLVGMAAVNMHTRR